MLQRVFGQYPRRLTCGILGCMNYTDFVWFWLAEKDGMVDTSLTYWFRCLDIDNDGFLSVHDLLTAYNMKVLFVCDCHGCPSVCLWALFQITAMMEAGMSVTPLLSPFDVMCQIMDAINPKEPGMISCLDLKRSNNASILFDVFVCMASTGPASISPVSARARLSRCACCLGVTFLCFAAEYGRLISQRSSVPTHRQSSQVRCILCVYVFWSSVILFCFPNLRLPLSFSRVL